MRAHGQPRSRDTYLAAQYRHLLRRFGPKGKTKAAFAVGHTIPVIAWHVMATDNDYRELGGDYFARRTDHQARQRQLVRQLEALGLKVNIEPAA